MVVGASSPEEKLIWVEDLKAAVASAKENNADLPNFASLKSTSTKLISLEKYCKFWIEFIVRI